MSHTHAHLHLTCVMVCSLGAALRGPAVLTTPHAASASRVTARFSRGVAVVALASTSTESSFGDSSSPETIVPGASLRAVLGADAKAWKQIISSPEGREMVRKSPKKIAVRLLGLCDALRLVSNVHDIDVSAMVVEQPSLATVSGDPFVFVPRAWRALQQTLGPDVNLGERARACPCGFAHVLRRAIDVVQQAETETEALKGETGDETGEEREEEGEEGEDVVIKDGDARSYDGEVIGISADTKKRLEKKLGQPLRAWLTGDAWFVVFNSCVGSEWGYLRTMQTYATKTVPGTSLAGFKTGSAYLGKNKQVR